MIIESSLIERNNQATTFTITFDNPCQRKDSMSIDEDVGSEDKVAKQIPPTSLNEQQIETLGQYQEKRVLCNVGCGNKEG